MPAPLSLLAAAKGAAKKSSRYGFSETAHGFDETHHVAPGYSADVLIRWGVQPVVRSRYAAIGWLKFESLAADPG